MSRPSRHDRSGFTLLECEIGILILALLAVGLSNLIVSHERLLADVDSWTQGGPVYYVEQPALHYERIIGSPATLSPDPVLPPLVPAPGAIDVTVLSVALELHPPTATVNVVLVGDPDPGGGWQPGPKPEKPKKPKKKGKKPKQGAAGNSGQGPGG